MKKAINIMKMNRQKSKYYVKSPAEMKEIIKASRSTGSMIFMKNNLEKNLFLIVMHISRVICKIIDLPLHRPQQGFYSEQDSEHLAITSRIALFHVGYSEQVGVIPSRGSANPSSLFQVWHCYSEQVIPSRVAVFMGLPRMS